MAGRTPTEAELAAAWEAGAGGPTPLVDSRGRRLHVVFPGRRWGGPGPDFRRAVLADRAVPAVGRGGRAGSRGGRPRALSGPRGALRGRPGGRRARPGGVARGRRGARLPA